MRERRSTAATCPQFAKLAEDVVAAMAAEDARRYAVVGGYLRDLQTGESPTVETALGRRGCRADIERRRQLRRHFLSRAEVRRVLSDSAFHGPTTKQLSYAETAVAHARLAGIPATDSVNCWPLDRLLAWLSDAASARHR